MYYFTRRKGPSEFGEDYWGKKTDPDGVERDMREERDRKCEDLKEEIGFLNALPPSKILDVGCGLGHVLSALDSKHKRYGFEISDFCKQYIVENYPDIAVMQAASFRGNLFKDIDAILCYHVIEHVRYPEEFVKALYDTLHLGGHLIIGTPDFGSPAAQLYGERYRMLHDETHISLFTQGGLVNLLQNFGFDVERVYYPYWDCERMTQQFTYAADVTAYFAGNRILEGANTSPPMPGDIFTLYARKVK